MHLSIFYNGFKFTYSQCLESEADFLRVHKIHSMQNNLNGTIGICFSKFTSPDLFNSAHPILKSTNVNLLFLLFQSTYDFIAGGL